MIRFYIAVLLCVLMQLKGAGQMSANAPLTIPGVLRLNNENLQTVLDLYASLTERTPLVHPLVTPRPFSLVTTNHTREQARVAVESLLGRQGISLIPDGDKFILVVPAAQTNVIRPRSLQFVPPYDPSAQAPTNVLAMPDAMMDLRDTPLLQAAYIYGAFADREFTNSRALPAARITLRTGSSLSRAEMCYALETLFGWHGLQIVTNNSRGFTLRPGLPQNSRSAPAR